MSEDKGSFLQYTRLAISLHWIIAGMVILMIALGLSMTDIPKGTPERSLYYNFHKSLGVTILLLMFVRLAWRWLNPPPPLPESIPTWQAKLSRVSHICLYICLFLMPLSGFAATQFTKWGLKFFGLFKIPPLAFEDKGIYEALQCVHGVTGWVLITIISIHILAAIKHEVVDKDNVLQRIFNPTKKQVGSE